MAELRWSCLLECWYQQYETSHTPSSCSKCNIEFDNRAEKPLSYAQCGNTFKKCSLLSEHERTHTNDKPLSVVSPLLVGLDYQ